MGGPSISRPMMTTVSAKNGEDSVSTFKCFGYLSLLLMAMLCDAQSLPVVADELPGGALQIRPPRRPPNQNTIWGLNENDSFTVSVNIEKKTTVRIGDGPETTSRTNDVLTLNYYVTQVLPDKDCLFFIEIGLGDRAVNPEAPDAIQQASRTSPATDQQTLPLLVSPDGSARLRSKDDARKLMQSLAITDPQVERLLAEACPDDVIVSWLARPFWIAPRNEDKLKEQSWVQPVAIATGNFGSMIVDAEMKLESSDEEYANVSIGGKGRFRPLVVPEKVAETRAPLLKSVSVELDEFSGKARMWKSIQKEKPADNHRPMLEDLSLTCRIHGAGTLPAREKTPEQKVTFEQVQVQSWLVTAHSIGLLDYRLSPTFAP